MSMPFKLDHLAIGVKQWADAYPRFAVELGGRWSHGGGAGEFWPYQLTYRDDMRLEFISPGDSVAGFMRRFIDRNGPGAHHITFKVPSLDRALEEIGDLGISVLGGRTNMDFWQEAFLHPKLAGVGTLIQVAQIDEEAMDRMKIGAKRPEGFPEQLGPQHGVAWIGLSVESLDQAKDLFVGVLKGNVVEEGPGWARLSWGPSRGLLLRDASGAPGNSELWAQAPFPGVAHLMFGPVTLSVDDIAARRVDADLLPQDPLTHTPVWMVDHPVTSD